MSRVPYRGSAPIVNDLIGGHLPFGITTIADAIAQHRAGGVRILAVSSAARSPFLPEVPTLKENGIDLVADAWYGMWLPAGSPPAFAKQLSDAVAAALAKPEVREKLLAIGLIPVGTTPEGLTQELAANTAFWQPIVKATRATRSRTERVVVECRSSAGSRPVRPRPRCRSGCRALTWSCFSA